MHSRLAGSRGDGVEAELKQKAREGSLRRDGDDAAPARHTGRTHSRPNGSVPTLSLRPREEPQEGCGLGTPAAPTSTANTKRWQHGERASSG